jgi:hypothetical protein
MRIRLTDTNEGYYHLDDGYFFFNSGCLWKNRVRIAGHYPVSKYRHLMLLLELT